MLEAARLPMCYIIIAWGRNYFSHLLGVGLGVVSQEPVAALDPEVGILLSCPQVESWF